MGTDWFALQVRPQAEKMVSVLLRAKGYEEFCPTYTARRRWSDRVKEIQLPLFPGYVFCRIVENSVGRVVTTPGVRRIVGCGNDPVSIEEDEITALQRIVRSQVPVAPYPFLQVGQRVKVDRGPLAGVCGVILKLKNNIRLVVSVTLLQRAVSVEVDRELVSPAAAFTIASPTNGCQWEEPQVDIPEFRDCTREISSGMIR